MSNLCMYVKITLRGIFFVGVWHKEEVLKRCVYYNRAFYPYPSVCLFERRDLSQKHQIWHKACYEPCED